MREKLIELLHSGVRCPGPVASCTDCPHQSLDTPCDEFGATADMLIENGVTIPVRCKDCKHMGETKFVLHWCHAWGNRVKEDGFCSYGERKDNAID